MNASADESLPYRPRVELLNAECSFALGGYRFALFSSGMRSLGAVNYKHLLGVLDEQGRDVLYVTAETNPFDGDAVVYLGRFDAAGHATMACNPALADAAAFLPAALRVARDSLALPDDAEASDGHA